MHDPSFMALALVVSLQDPSQYTINSRSRLKIELRVELNSSRCMHNTSLMALALIVSEKMMQILDKSQ